MKTITYASSKLAYLIPVTYIIAFVLFWAAVKYKIVSETQGESEIKELLYSVFFFLAEPVFSYILFFLLLIPFVVLIVAIYKKRKDIITGSSICAFISLSILILASVF